MSSNNFNNNNLVQTSLNDAYNFNTFSDFIQKQITTTRFSLQCIVCLSNKTISLVGDGSFRQCSSCNKQFKSLLISNK